MEYHDVSNLIPAMSKDEFRELASDIARKGLLEPIWTHEDKIIDGRHRYRACCILGKDPVFREWKGEGGTVLAFVVSQNLHRRQLTPTQRAAVAAEIQPIIEAEIREQLREKQRQGGKKAGRSRPVSAAEKVLAKNGQHLSRETLRNSRYEAASVSGVSRSYASEAIRIKKASPELFEEIRSGKITMKDAKRKLASTITPKNKPPKEWSLHENLESLHDKIRLIVSEWPEKWHPILASKLVSLGNELKNHGGIRE